MARILLSGGTVVNATGAAPADVLVDGETIAALLAPGSDLVDPASVDRLIDATGKLVVPGGVDAHTHMELPVGELTASDTFETGTTAAAWGGTTTIIDFANQYVGDTVPGCIDEWHTKADGNCVIDYGFHLAVGDVNEESLKHLERVVDEGITSYKLFMAYPGRLYSDDAQILRTMQVASRTGAMVMMHAENGIAIDVLAAQAVEKGLVDPVQHGLTRPKALEAEATFRAIKLAEVAQSPLYIVHLSADGALDQVVEARDRGAPVFAETCPQYLYLSLEEHLSRPGEAGAAYVCSPPLRSRDDGNHDNLWRGLRTDDLSVVATDHCPFCLEDQKAPALGDFRRIPNGLGSVEHRLDLLHQGVVTGEIGLPRWVELCSTTPARLFGLYPHKGVIAPGSDADLVVYDPTARQTLGVATHHMNLDHSAYEGIEVTGRVETVLSRGSVVLDERRFTGRRGHGRYLERGLAEPLR